MTKLLNKTHLLLAGVVMLLLVAVYLLMGTARAAITNPGVSLSDSAGGAVGVNPTFTFTPSALNTGDGIQIEYDDAFTGVTNLVAGDVTLTDAGADITTTVSVDTGASLIRAVVTTEGATANDQITVSAANGRFTNQAAGSYRVIIKVYDLGDDNAFGGVGSNADTLEEQTIALAYIGGANQVTVNAVVEPILTIALDDNTLDLGTLDTSSVANVTGTVTIATNAQGGYTLNANSVNSNASDGLYDSVSGEEIPATGATNVSAGTSSFAVFVGGTTAGANGDGTMTVAAGFDGAASATSIDTSAQSVVTSNGTTNGDVITMSYNAAVDAVQAAGNYATTVTYTVTGNF